MKLKHQIEIEAPPAVVWSTTVAIEQWPEWTPTVNSASLETPAPLAIGSRARLRQPGLPEAVWTVTELEEERRFAWTSRVLGMSMTATHLIEASGAGTRNTLQIETSGLASALFGWALRSSFRKALQRENEGLAAFCRARAEG